ncbi:hypothetical protein JW848_03285, partial [Candidatus Bipolaricaulota bacterium]|nr:hypothetical protein [Candidatus Bipolaricaulota bacterium]
ETWPTGILFQGPERPCFGDRFRSDRGWSDTPMMSLPWLTPEDIAMRAEAMRVGVGWIDDAG